MQTKLKFVLYIIFITIFTVLIIGHIYGKQSRETAYNPKRQYSIETKQYRQKIHKEEKIIETETDKGVDAQAINPVSLGEFKLTAYCSCEICCGKWANSRPNGIVYGAIGEELKEGYSIAVDPNIIPYRTEVIINGKTYKAQDCGGAIKGKRIDVYFKNHSDALNFGIKYAEVFIKM